MFYVYYNKYIEKILEKVINSIQRFIILSFCDLTFEINYSLKYKNNTISTLFSLFNQLV